MFRMRNNSQSAEISYAPVRNYPQSYTDFILSSTRKEERATVSFAALCLFLEGLVDLAPADMASLESVNAFINIINSLPKNELISTSTMSNNDDKMLINARYIFVDQESDFILRPFFQKAIIQSLERDDHAYLIAINRFLDTLGEEAIDISGLSEKEKKGYVAIYNNGGSNEQLLRLIDIFIQTRYSSANADEENLKNLQKNVTEKEERNKSELLRLEASILQKTSEITRLKRNVDKQMLQRQLVDKDLSNEAAELTIQIDKKTTQLEKLKNQIADEQTKNDVIQSKISKIERHLIEMQKNFHQLKKNEAQQKIEQEEIKQDRNKFSQVTVWLAQKLDHLQVELSQKVKEKTFYNTPSKSSSEVALKRVVFATPPKKTVLTPQANNHVHFEPVECTGQVERNFAPVYTPSRQAQAMSRTAQTSSLQHAAKHSPAIERVGHALQKNVMDTNVSAAPLGLLEQIQAGKKLKKTTVTNNVQEHKSPSLQQKKASVPMSLLDEIQLGKKLKKTSMTNNAQKNQSPSLQQKKASAPMSMLDELKLKKALKKAIPVEKPKNTSSSGSDFANALFKRRKQLQKDESPSSSCSNSPSDWK